MRGQLFPLTPTLSPALKFSLRFASIAGARGKNSCMSTTFLMHALHHPLLTTDHLPPHFFRVYSTVNACSSFPSVFPMYILNVILSLPDVSVVVRNF